MKRKNNVFWVIGGGQLQVPLIDEARKLGLSVLVTDEDEHCIARKFADFFYPVDIFDLSKNIELLFDLQMKGFIFRGILAAGIDANVINAVLSKIADLPGTDPRGAYTTHNKAAFRNFLTKNKLPHPKWEEVTNLEEAKHAIKKIEVPFIIKNIDSSASRGSRKFFSKPTDKVLEESLENAKKASSTNTALIEELLYGPEQTVETLFDINGKFWPCFITDRAFDAKNEWAVEIGLRHPTTLPKDKQRKLYNLVKLTADKLGIKIGAAKADTIYTKKGPVMLEMTTRLSGGFDCQYLVPAATGKNVLQAAILTAISKPFPKKLLVDTKHHVGFTASLWPKPGIITSIKGFNEAQKIPGVKQIFLRHKVGDVVQPYTDSAKRTCFIIAAAKTEAMAQRAINQALHKIKIETKI